MIWEAAVGHITDTAEDRRRHHIVQHGEPWMGEINLALAIMTQKVKDNGLDITVQFIKRGNMEGFIDTREVDQFQALMGVLYEQIDTRELSPYTEEEMEAMRNESYNRGTETTCCIRKCTTPEEKGKETS